MASGSFVNLLIFGKIFGLKSLALFYWKQWALCNLPLLIPVFGVILHREELLNIRDNILQGSIRDRDVERQIRKARQPVIVDCGINVGVTVRWWFYLNPRATVYGVDMMQEANDFTLRALPGGFNGKYVPITAVLASETGSVREIQYNDPLFGGNSVDATDKYSESRRVFSRTLDDCLRSYNIDTVDLLKVDIENSAADMFRGAVRTLSKAKNISLEIHSEREREDSVRLLSESGFCVKRSLKRHVWMERVSKK